MARKGTMTTETIESRFLQETMTINIYAPEEFDPIYETHLCIMQDGNDYFQMGRIATFSDRLHDDYDIVNTYFIGIHYIDRKDRVKKYAPTGQQNEAYMHFLTDEVLPLLDEKLPLNPLGVIRTIMGDSLAATLAFMTATTYPTLFQQVVMQSPLVDEHVLAQANAMESNDMKIYHSIGLQEASVDTTELGIVDFVGPNKQLADILQTKCRAYTYEEIAEGNHTWKFWQKEMPSVMELMFG